ncbi:RNA 2',3'-cyclic phosphodiesterase [Nocardioides donggukensis]|uniref:RNA 2',3'-cyclic phosphodiesterase n=1 Tax=Nocardioides donggukensis TaxID=2774019 RepID=A0A927K385_9ACTN|nr:RNA 2',3'-cyclic phosphodiesterase [Nocardioides donggukensis]MBD8868130.1 RNA 2',3'-cyclic phosphodiesterase [Nocardioides donggukensis]
MRLFVAVTPSEEAVEDLDGLLAPRREAGAFRWSDPGQWHLTLAFLPDVADRRLDDLGDRLARAAGRRTSFELALAGGGAFPNPARARVLWAGLRAEESARTELDRLATGARAAANRAGAAPEGARFRAHLTLARLGRPAEVGRWVRLLDGYAGPAWAVDEIALIASHLGEGPRNRPRHEVLDRFPLAP